jgi:CPA1 family monovalent cation:H+ antiporter
MEGDDPKLAFLARVSLFAELERDELAAVSDHLRDLDAPAGTVVIEEGDEGGEFFIVNDGALEIRSQGRLLAELGPGEFTGEMALMFGGRRNASAIASVPSRLYVMDKDGFTALLQRAPRVENKLLDVVAQRMRYR